MFFRKICLIAIPSGFFNVWLRQNGVQQFVTITRRPFNASVGQLDSWTGLPTKEYDFTDDCTVRNLYCLFLYIHEPATILSIYATTLCSYAGQYVFGRDFYFFGLFNQKSKNHNKKHIVPNDNTRWLDI